MIGLVWGTALAAILGMLGCASTGDWSAAGTSWNRPETTTEEFERDKAECEAGPEGQVPECLRAKGYFPWAERSPQERARDTLPSF